MTYLILIALATLIYVGVWMFAAPSKALSTVNRVSTEINRYDRTTVWLEMEPISESTAIRVAIRFAGLALILFSVIRLIEIT